MAKILVYNYLEDVMEEYNREENETMPYAEQNTLTVNEFRGSSNSSVLWTDRRAMEAWNAFRDIWGKPIYVGFAFKRIWEGGHSGQSQHYAGVAFDSAQNFGSVERNRLRNTAINSGIWSYVEPAYLTPTWVHVDKRQFPPACAAGYPALKVGDKGVYVLVLQDALNAYGITGAGLDGIFGRDTEQAVKKFQQEKGLTADGIVGCITWTLLTSSVVGMGRTNTVVSP